MNKKVLIVGGSGFIAKNLIEKLVSESYDVSVYGRNSPSVCTANVRYIEGELGTIASNMRDIDGSYFSDVIYLSNNIPVNSSVNNYNELVGINKIAIDYLCKVTSRFVFFSSGGRVYADSLFSHRETDLLGARCLYGKSKIELEHYVSAAANINRCDFLIVRPSNPYGRYQLLNSNQGLISVTIGKVLSNSPVEIWGGGAEIRDYIFIDDFIDSFYRLLSFRALPYNIFNIGSGLGHSTLEVVTTILNLMGRHDVVVDKVNVNHALIPSNILCNDRLYEVIGRKSYTSLSDGIRKLLDYHRNTP
ncbi:NAD-dependent epimerase/dehydratase family protein [Aeromonas sp. SrichE-2G]|uniref:NAD-dependent epimerase/dehydratase family protein n=1 Tax=Aeromonas sp. SrichE-2G TaxID=2823359 RepID=UPI001B31E702|nr:NAD-dependent epimerase/dehydratase family protein [Aeromonas sp. SrichE-2G]MBP4043192.1 NAD-dependent epimerase/dehydratase family protein [Aeromonas sp. SrichE-2G]